MPNLTNSLSAFEAYGTAVNAVTHNIANINTNNFKAYRVDMATGPNDQGVQVGLISRDFSPGPAIVTNFSSFDAGMAKNSQTADYDLANASSILAQEQTAKNEYGETVATWNKAASREYTDPVFRSFAEGSNVDLPLEFSNLIIAEHTYGANAGVIRAVDDMTGSVLNLKV